jgi:ribosome assembly protein YihI (activator of Der GTPase)
LDLTATEVSMTLNHLQDRIDELSVPAAGVEELVRAAKEALDWIQFAMREMGIEEDEESVVFSLQGALAAIETPATNQERKAE